MSSEQSPPQLSDLAIKAGLALHRSRSGNHYKLSARDKVEALTGSLLPTIPIVALCALLAAHIAWAPERSTSIAAWLIVMLLLVGLRAWTHLGMPIANKGRSRKAAGSDWDSLFKRNLAYLMAGGFGWAAYALLFMPHLDAAGRLSILCIMVCMATSLMITTRVVPYFSNMMTVLLIAPSAAIMLLGDADQVPLATLAFAYMVALIASSHINQRRVAAAIGMARMHDRLIVDAVRQQKKVESLNAELRDAQNSLIVLNQQLEERVKLRTSLLRREITEREGYQKRLEEIASSDPLTGLANRARLASTIALELDAALDDKSHVAVFFIDLDRFKEINDCMGHYSGDRVLETVAVRLKEKAVGASCIARWGGDEFVIVKAVAVADERSLELFAEEIVAALSEPIKIGSEKAKIGASVGIAVFPEHGKDPESLIKHADLAVYQAKVGGRGCVRLFRPDWQHRARERIQMVQALKDAIESDTLLLNYQPILDPVTGRVSSMEALLRWHHPEFGTVSPAVFVALAEESGLMVSLGNWVLRRACLDARHIVGPHCERVAVNVSAHQFSQGDFMAVLDGAMLDSGLDASGLELELTETVYAQDANRVRETLQSIRRRGVKIAIDDFGTGYSSLAYLQRFPVDVLKVDRSFVRDLGTGGDTIIAAVTSLARSLGVSVVVEGIETTEQLIHVRNLGADQVQGFLFARPMALEPAITWLHGNRVDALLAIEPVLDMPALAHG